MANKTNILAVCCALLAGAAAAGDLQCSNTSSFRPGGTSVHAYLFENTSDAAVCCSLCNDAKKCGHFVFVPAQQQGQNGTCKLKQGTPKSISGGEGGVCGGCGSAPPGPAPGPKPKGPTPSPAVPTPPPSPAPADAPNILLLFPDQWRFDWDGFHSINTGPIPIKLPTTMSVAARGTRFLQAYVPAPVCAPSRSCLASGREYDFNDVPSNGHDYNISLTTFYSVLRSAGYHTMTTGKDDLTKATQLGSHNGYPGCPECKPGDGRYHQKELGFSDALRFSGKMDVVDKPQPHEMYGYFLLNQSVTTEGGQKTNGWDAHRACMGKGDKSLCDKTTFDAHLYEDDFTADNAVKLLQRRDKTKPFFLHVSFPGPHDPFLVTAAMRAAASDGRVWPPATDDPKNNTPGGACDPTGEPDGKRVRCNYAAELENLDRLFKVVLDEVDSQGVMGKTVVCIASDHGEMLGDHGDVDKSKPWEGSAHVPLMCAGPGIKQNATVNLPVATMDMAGTFMDYASAKPAPGMTTVSWRPLLEGKPASSYRPFVSSGLANFRMVVKDLNATTYKYICCNGECPNPPSTAPKVGKSGWMQMLIAPQLDPYDMKDLTAAHPDIVTELRALLPPAYAAGCAKIDAEG